MFISLAIFSKAPSPLSSGVVVAGFGEEEIFPTVVSLECDGYIGDKLKLYNENEIDISRKMSGAMRAFAQGEMVHRFMDGFDPMLARSVFTAFGEVLNDSCIKVMEKYSAKSKQTGKIRAEISAASAKALGQLVENFREYTQKAFSRPIVEMVSLLPKDELANLAESLVALTSLKRRVSHDLETVGGAIDVAIISKSDGFAWVKRKHYFPSDLNPSFNRNYMNGIHKEIDL